ncbi:MAG TPA: hypothetical protein VET27_10485 [Mycobacterium sp.]|nr:hypothetical protein [Mycobacterium sp.]
MTRPFIQRSTLDCASQPKPIRTSMGVTNCYRPSLPQGTRQFSAAEPRPTCNGHHPPVPGAPVPAKQARFARTQVGLLAGTIAMFALAAVLAAVLVFTGGSTDSEPQSPLAAQPPSTTTVTTTAPSTSEESTPSSSTSTSTTPTTPTPSPSTIGATLSGVSGTDGQGFVGHSARCDAGSAPAAAIRTANSLAIVCETAPGSYYYRDEHLSDGAQLQLANAVEASTQ